jgi:cyclic pyranopterin phosphate synthase
MSPPRDQKKDERGLGGLTHLDASGSARMVDVSGKAESQRRAVASGRIRMQQETLSRILAGDAPKGDVLGVARVAGIQAGKRTGELIPLCHVLPGATVSVTLEADRALPGIIVRAEASCSGQTGVEMEALTAAAVALLTVYDMAKGLERGMVLEAVQLERKEGGRSGVWERSVDAE